MAIKQQIKAITNNNKQTEHKLKEEAKQIKQHKREQLKKDIEHKKKRRTTK